MCVFFLTIASRSHFWERHNSRPGKRFGSQLTTLARSWNRSHDVGTPWERRCYSHFGPRSASSCSSPRPGSVVSLLRCYRIDFPKAKTSPSHPLTYSKPFVISFVYFFFLYFAPRTTQDVFYRPFESCLSVFCFLQSSDSLWNGQTTKYKLLITE